MTTLHFFFKVHRCGAWYFDFLFLFLSTIIKAARALRGIKRRKSENWRIPNCPPTHILMVKPDCTFLSSHLHLSFCLFISWGGVEPSRMKRLCYQSCKMVYYPVSNCTWKGTSNLYEKCLRLPAHPVIHARSVPVMPENKRRCTSLEGDTLSALRACEGKH